MIEESGSHRTPRWREMDSISRFAYFFEQSSNHAIFLDSEVENEVENPTT